MGEVLVGGVEAVRLEGLERWVRVSRKCNGGEE